MANANLNIKYHANINTKDKIDTLVNEVTTIKGEVNWNSRFFTFSSVVSNKNAFLRYALGCISLVAILMP